MALPPEDDAQRRVNEMRRQREKLERMVAGVQLPLETIRALQNATRISPATLQAFQDAMRIPPETLKAFQDATRIPPEAWKAIEQASRIPTGQWDAYLAATRVPLQSLEKSLRALHQAAAANWPVVTTNWDAAVEDAVAEVNNAAAVEQGDSEVSWLLRLPFVQQLGLLVAFLHVLDALGQFIADLAGEDDLPPEVRSGTQVLFAVVAVLLMVVELRSRTKDG